jgi:hypothetical protein
MNLQAPKNAKKISWIAVELRVIKKKSATGS